MSMLAGLEPQRPNDARRPDSGLADLRALAQVIIEISRSLDLDHVLNASLSGIQRVVGGDLGCFLLIQNRTPTLQVTNATSLPAPLRERLEGLLVDLGLDAQDASTASRIRMISQIGLRVGEILTSLSIDSYVLIPLTALSRAIGVLLVVTRTGKVLEPRGVDLLLSIGEQVGLAIENARLHASVRESEEWHRAFMENSLDAFWEGDLRGRITYVNDAACKLLGYEREELLRMHLTDFTLGDPATQAAASAELSQKGVLINRDAQVMTRSGRIRTVNYTTRLMRDAQGNAVHYQSISRDITEQQDLIKTLSQRNEELAALNAIAGILSHPLELERSLDQVCEQIVSITGMDTATLHLVDESSQYLNLLAQRGLSDNLLSQVRRAGLDDPVTRSIAVEGQVVALDDVGLAAEPSFAGPRADGYHAGIGMPIRMKNAYVGAMFVGSKTKTRYDQEDVNLLQNISNQISVALESADLYAQMQRRVQELDALAQLSAACTTSLDPKVLADIATTWTRKLIPADLCSLRLIEDDAAILASGSVEPAAPLKERVDLDAVFRKLIEQRTPYVISDFADESVSPVHRERFRGISIRSFLAVPMPVPDRVIGILAVGHAASHTWQSREVELLQTIANQTANAIHNAILFQNILSEQRKIQAILDSGLSGLYATDAAGRIVLFNRAAERVTGWTLDQVRGRAWQEIFDDADPLICAALERKETAYEPEGCELRTRDGRVIPVAEAVAPLFDEKGEVTGAVGAFWDLTKEKAAELSRERFLLMVAHQLRSPLSALLSALQLLERESLNKKQRAELWDIVKSGGARLKKFADEFLDLEAAIKSPRPVQLEPLPIVALARNLIHKFETESRGHRFRVRSRKPEPMVLADPDRVENVLCNLLDNAVSYSPADSQVTVSIQPLDHATVDIAVQDHGAGIPLEDQEHIFEPFYRSSKATAQHSYGHGLGLSIAQGMVKEMGGEIWVESKKSRGTAFHFTLRRAG